MEAQAGVRAELQRAAGADPVADPSDRGEEPRHLTDPEFFDSHCHLTAERLRDDIEGVLERARDAGVTRCVTIASDADDSEAAIALAAAHDGLHATAGIHPHAAGDAPADAASRIADLADRPGVVALGETGLDYYYDNAPRAVQRRLFDTHLKLAAETGLPVVVHSRDADDDTAAALRDYAGEVRGVLHCFAGGSVLLDTGIDVGWWISFSGLVTFRSYTGQGLIREVPEDRLLIETDSPYLAPVPHRGQTNEPGFLPRVAEAVADARGVAVADIAARTWANAAAFYGVSRDR